MVRVLMGGNEAIGEGAIRGGCDAYFGYPITPQTELLEYMSVHMHKNQRAFVQAESEIAAINMVYGAASTGKRAMTSSSSPGISLKQEGISYLAGAELPAVIVNVSRGGPGLGSIAPAQSDYFQATKGGGHGDYQSIVLAPASVQESMDLTAEAFELAEEYRMPAIILVDGVIAQMMEPVELRQYKREQIDKSYILSGAKGREPRVVTSAELDVEKLDAYNRKLQAKYARLAASEQRSREYWTEDADILVVAYGTMARISQTAVKQARAEGIRAGLLRPITLYPLPSDNLSRAVDRCQAVLVAELSMGQMVEDVRLVVNGRVPVDFYGTAGGLIPTAEPVLERIKSLAAGGKGANNG